MNNNVVAIPTIIMPQRAVFLAFEYSHDDAVEEVWILDNGHTEEDAAIIKEMIENDPKISYLNTRGMTLYEQWNYAMQLANTCDFTGIVISNDDVTISENMVSKLEKALYEDDNCWIVYPAAPQYYHLNGLPQVTNGTKADGGLDGSCFMLKIDALRNGLPPIDERFIWWGGDDDLAMSISTFNKTQKRVNDAYFVHQNEGTVSASNQFDHLHEAKLNDKFLLRQKWRINR